MTLMTQMIQLTLTIQMIQMTLTIQMTLMTQMIQVTQMIQMTLCSSVKKSLAMNEWQQDTRHPEMRWGRGAAHTGARTTTKSINSVRLCIGSHCISSFIGIEISSGIKVNSLKPSK